MASWKKTFYIMWLAQFCSIMGFSFVLPFMPLYVRELGVSGDANVAWWAGLASSATGFSLMFFSPIWGHLADHYGRKPMVLRSMFGGAVVLALMGLSRNVTDLVILRAIQGALTGTVTATVALVASVVPAHRAGFALGMMQAAVFAGGSIGPLLGGEMWDRFGPQAPFLMAGAVLALGGLVVKFAVVEDFTRHPASEKHRRGSFREVFTAAGFLAAALVIFQIQFANMVRQPVFVLFIEELYGSGEAVARFVGRLMFVAGLVAAVFAGVFGRYADTWGHKRMLVFCTVLAGLAVLPQALARNVWELGGLQVVFGLAVAGMMPSVNAIVTNVMSPQNLGKAFGVTSSVRCLGMALGPLTGGYLAIHTGLRGPFVVTGVLLLATALLVLWSITPPTSLPGATPAPATDAPQPPSASPGGATDSL